MFILFYITAFLFSLGQLGRISFFNQQVNIYLYEIFLIFSLFTLFLECRFQPIKEAWKNNKSVFVFFAILIISLFLDFAKYKLFENIIGIIYLSRLLLYFLYFFYLKFYISKKPEFTKIIKNGLIGIAILIVASTLVQYFLYPDLRNLIYQGWDPHLYRTFGVFFDTSISAAIFGLIFLINDQLIIKCIYLILIALSFSRSTYLGLICTTLFLFLPQKQFKKIFLFLILFIGMIFFIPKPNGEGVNLKRLYSIESRIEDYRKGIDLWKKKPLIGYGYNRIRYIKKSDSIHSGAGFNSSFLTILVSSGIIGLIAFIWTLWGFRRDSKIAMTLIIFLSIVSLFDNVLLHPFILFLFFISLACDP
jgi:O-antigen ligase